METVSRRKPQPAYALYAIAIGGGFILICLAILSIALTASKKTTPAEVDRQPRVEAKAQVAIWPWEKKTEDKRKEILQARWLLHKSIAYNSTNKEWSEPLGRFVKLELNRKSVSTSDMMKPAGQRIEELHAKFDGMMIRIRAKYGDAFLSDIDPEMTARIAEKESELRTKIRQAVSPFANEAETRAYKACNESLVSDLQIQDDLQHYYDMSIKAALAAAKEHFIEITGMTPNDNN